MISVSTDQAIGRATDEDLLALLHDDLVAEYVPVRRQGPEGNYMRSRYFPQALDEGERDNDRARSFLTVPQLAQLATETVSAAGRAAAHWYRAGQLGTDDALRTGRCTGARC